MSLTEIERSLNDDSVVNELCQRNSLVINIARCIGGEDLAVANKATIILKKISESKLGMQLLVSNDLLTVFHEVMTTSEVIRLRVYEVSFINFHIK